MECEQYCDKCNTDNCDFVMFEDLVFTVNKIRDPLHVYKKIQKKTCVENVITYYTENGNWFSINKPYENSVLGVELSARMLGTIADFKGVNSTIKREKELIKFLVVISFGKIKINLVQYTYYIHNIKPITFTYCIDGIERSVKF